MKINTPSEIRRAIIGRGDPMRFGKLHQHCDAAAFVGSRDHVQLEHAVISEIQRDSKAARRGDDFSMMQIAFGQERFAIDVDRDFLFRDENGAIARSYHRSPALPGAVEPLIVPFSVSIFHLSHSPR